jgi:hypothetical protein
MNPKYPIAQQFALVPMKCPGCGAGLPVVQAMEYVACGYCRTSVRTTLHDIGPAPERPSPIENAATKAQIARDRAAAELALRRLGKDLDKVDIEYGELCSEKTEPPLSPSQSSREANNAYPKLLKQWLNEQDLLVPRMRTLQKKRADIMSEMAINKKILGIQ